MLSCCCSNLTCPWKQVIRTDEFRQETVDGRELYTEDSAQTLESTRMDIALLKEQYNWIKEKQRQETRVVVFKKASTNEEIIGKSPVSVVPMHQEMRRRPLQRQLSMQEAQSDIFQDQGNSLWRTHLGLHRNGCTASYHNQDPIAIQSNLFRDSSLESTESSEKLTSDPEELEGSVSLGSSTSGQEAEDGKPTRQFSAPSVLSRRSSLIRSRPAQAPSTARHYPFPQLKCPRKSEAARRLGMYASF
ncbi:uncharacterized protein C9orf152-like [Sardina pilchardus]|uniref:uncharacterized protein C9orf152-like n=1 Tax=Sardina pilchardus TaxID=27697 RepID=UPI002E15B472